MNASATSRNPLLTGALAGLAAAVVFDLFNMVWGGALHQGMDEAIFGAFAGADPVTRLMYVLIIPIAWGIGYVYLSRSQPQVLRRPIISGIVYGLVVYVVIQVMLLSVGLYHRGGPGQFARSIIGYGLFFGPALAFTVARLTR